MMLLEKGIIDTNYKVEKEKDSLLIPVLKRFKTKYEFIDKTLKKIEKQKKNLKELLKDELTDEEIESLKTAYDHVGNIAIIRLTRN